MKNIRDIVEKIESITGPCDYNEDEINEADDTFEMWIDVSSGIGIEIDVDSLKISLFVSFSYYDFKKSDIENGNYDPEDLSYEIRTHLLENSFALFMKAHSPNHTVVTWDDGGYMCPGYVARVGFHQEDYTDAIVKDFLNVHNAFLSTIEVLNDLDIRNYIVNCICHNHDIRVQTNCGEIRIGDASLKICDSKNIPDSNVDYYYLGKEYFLFSAEGTQYAVDVHPVRLLIEANDLCELIDSLTFYVDIPPLFNSPLLRIISAHMELAIKANMDTNHIYSRIEETTTIMSNSSIIPFASEQFKEVYHKTYSSIIDSYSGEAPLIITEGSTDWKHIKKYWEQFHSTTDVKFLEYEPANSKANTPIKLEMGSSALIEMCNAYSKLDLGKTFIFIADRDEPKIVTSMGGKTKRYKYWGNHVYSFVLPLPPHRDTTPNICIEHYYSDDEIKTPYLCSDGIERRLFLGNDFDKYGRNVEKGLLCIKRNICGSDSIRVIDGSSDVRVVSTDEKGDTNYALSKSEFSSRSTISADSSTYTAFREIFNIIDEIIVDSKKRS